MFAMEVMHERNLDGMTVQYGRFDTTGAPPSYDFPLLVGISDGDQPADADYRETIIDRNWVTAVLGRFAVYPPLPGQSETLGQQVVHHWRNSWLKNPEEPKVLGGLEAINVIGFVGTLVHGTDIEIDQINAVRLRTHDSGTPEQ